MARRQLGNHQHGASSAMKCCASGTSAVRTWTNLAMSSSCHTLTADDTMTLMPHVASATATTHPHMGPIVHSAYVAPLWPVRLFATTCLRSRQFRQSNPCCTNRAQGRSCSQPQPQPQRAAHADTRSLLSRRLGRQAAWHLPAAPLPCRAHNHSICASRQAPGGNSQDGGHSQCASPRQPTSRRRTSSQCSCRACSGHSKLSQL